MATLVGNERATKTARVGSYARCSTMRCGFTPLDTDGGTANEDYMWTMVRGVVAKEPAGADAVWTNVK